MTQHQPELAPDDFAQAAWFAAAEAASQGYDLTSREERAGFYRHIEGSARQYFMARNCDRQYMLLAPDPDDAMGETFTVRLLAVEHGSPTAVLEQWDIPTPA